MRITRETRDQIVFFIGCAGMIAHGIVFPILAYPFDWKFFAGFASIAGYSVWTSGRRNGGDRRE